LQLKIGEKCRHEFEGAERHYAENDDGYEEAEL
jgi:hypothetical protein